MPSPIPAPLPPWARWLIQLAPLISVGLQAALEHIGTLNDSSSATPSEWRHVHLVGKPIGSVTASDRFITTMDIVNVTGGAVDSSWTQADYDSVSAKLFTLTSAWAAHMSPHYQWTEFRYYRRQFNPLTNPVPFVKSGPPELVMPATVSGSAVGELPPQASITSTDRSPYPRHWGRNYWPHPSQAEIDANGFVGPTTTNALATAVHDAYQALMASEFFPVVVVTQVDKQPVRGLLGVTEVQVDNLFDVVRRRRPKLPSQRVVLPVT